MTRASTKKTEYKLTHRTLKNRIIKELHSRSVVVDFDIPPNERAKLAKQFMERAEYILSMERVKYDVKVIAALIKKHFPDWRKIIGILQYESTLGEIGTRALSNVHDVELDDLIKFMKEKNYTSVRKWIAENGDIESAEFYRKFYDSFSEIFEKESIPYLVVLTSKYLYQDAFAADKEINMAAYLAEVIANASWKK